MKVNHDSKEVLAKLLAEEDLSVVFRNVSTASFSLSKRQLTLPIMQNSNQIVNWHVAHEVGHALFTPQDEYVALARRFGSLPNIVEDVRINDRVCDRYKGLKRLKKAAYEEMFETNFYGNDSLVIDQRNVNGLPFPDRINIHFKVGALAGIKFAADEQPIIDSLSTIKKWSEVEPAVKAIAKFMKNKEEQEKKEEERQQAEQDAEPEQSEEVDQDDEPMMPIFGEEEDGEEDGEEAEQFEDEEEKEDAEQIAGTESDEDSDEDDVEVETESSSAGNESDEDSDEDEPTDEDFDDIEAEEDFDEDSDSDEDSAGGGAGSDGDIGEDDPDFEDGEDNQSDEWDEDEDEDMFFQSETVRNEEESFEDSAIPQTEKDVYRTLRDYTRDWGKFVASEGFSRELLSSYSRHWSNTDNQMFEEFEKSNKKTIEDAAQTFLINRKIDYSSPEMVYHSGVIDTNKLHSYQIDDNIFLRETIIQDNSSKHGLIMMIDFSSSMTDRLYGTIQQAINLSMFAKEAMIPFEVYGFTWINDRVYDDQFEASDDVINPTEREHKPIFKIFDDQTDVKDFRKVANDLLFFSKWVNSHRHNVKLHDFLHSTPLDAALILAKYIGEDFKVKNGLEKLQFVFLTDGYSDDMPNMPTSFKPKDGKYKELSNLHITDPALKRTTTVQDKQQGITQMLSDNLTEYLDAGIVNFFITNAETYNMHKPYDKEELVPKAAFNAGRRYGFAETIVVNEKKFMIESVGINISSSRSAKASFAKKGRIAKTTRILMNDFAERIA